MKRLAVLFLVFSLTGCGDSAWNNPYPPEDAGKNILYSAFTERPKHLDPVQSYSSNEIVFTSQIYQPPLQYHYLKRPYELIPFGATQVPKPRFFDAAGRELGPDASAGEIARSVYEIHIKPGVRYQPHQAFAKGPDGRHLYHDLPPEAVRRVYVLSDLPETGTRELEAADYVYQIKRLAHPRLHSPILGLMADYIVGLKEYVDTLKKADAELQRGKPGAWLDLNQHPLAGVEVVDRHTYRVTLKGKYPQFAYWLAMPFFAPVPWEADRLYSQPGLAERNITLDWYPVGTGPYMLTVNDPNRQMVLERNPYYSGETYPVEGEPEDAAAGLLADAGKPLPFIDKVVFSLEKESIPYWNKFLQGYYDASGISSDSFDQAVQVAAGGDVRLTDEMVEKGILLTTSVAPSTYYMGFNMLDPVVGGDSERARKLRQAIAIAVDYEEFISIFANGRGVPAQGVIPPGIFGYREGQEGLNNYVYDWVDGRPRRKPIEAARKLLAEAGYPNGIDNRTGQPLLLNIDVTARGPDDKARLDWTRKQFEKLNVNLVVRATDYNRFQDKVRKGDAQLFNWGWNADYPDPENFMFLLHGAQGRVKFQGENSANYANAEYDALFEQMKNMDNGPRRQAIIDRMVEISRRDAPWLWGMHPKDYGLAHSWMYNRKPNQIANNTLKYQRIDPVEREKKRAEWNRPVVWPIVLVLAAVAALMAPGIGAWRRRERAVAGPGGVA